MASKSISPATERTKRPFVIAAMRFKVVASSLESRILPSGPFLNPPRESGTGTPSLLPTPMGKILIPCSAAFFATASTSPPVLSPSVIKIIAFSVASSALKAPMATVKAAPRSVPPTGRYSGERASKKI